MGRYLPREYTPVPDALFRSGSDLVDVARRVARNQNYLWARGTVLAAFGHEPMTTSVPTVASTASARCAVFAAPMRSPNGARGVQVDGLITASGGTATVRLYQLLPGEAAPTDETPYDEVAVTSGATLDPSGRRWFSFTARIRSGSDPLRFALDLIGGTVGETFSMVAANVSWSGEVDLVETPEKWDAGGTALPQTYVAANRSASAALLRAISNRTYGLVTGWPAVLFSHFFGWGRRSSYLTGLAELATWVLNVSGPNSLLDARATVTLRFRVTGQNTVVTPKITIRRAGVAIAYGEVVGTATTAPASVGSAPIYHSVYEQTFAVTVPYGVVQLHASFTTNTATTEAAAKPVPTYVGVEVLSCTVRLLEQDAVDLMLPAGDAIPAAYQPLDDIAVAPGRAVVAQNDRLGRRAGLYYLIRNLVWLAAKRSAHTILADWCHRTTTAGYNAPSDAGDGIYRNTTVPARSLGTAWPAYGTTVGFADRSAPTNAYAVHGTGTNHPGHHFHGDSLAHVACHPMNGGKVGGIVRPDLLYQPNSPWEDALGGEIVGGPAFDPSAFPYFRVGADPSSARSGFRVCAPAGAKPSAGTAMAIVGGVPADKVRHAPGMQVALHAAYIHELPLTQADLDALP